MTPEQQYALLVDSLRLAAAPAEQQIALLPSFVVTADEVATTFGDAFLLVPQLETAGLVSKGASAAMLKLDDWFAGTSDSSLGTHESLRSGEFWEAARSLAKAALTELSEEIRQPDLDQITWVPG